MHHLYPAVIYGGSPENDVWNARFVAFGHILGIVEPGKVHHARAIGKVSHYARLAVSHVKRLETEYSAAYLDKRHVARQFVDGIDSTSVDMFVGVILQQVAKGIDAQFFAKHLFAVGSDPRHILDILLQYVGHRQSVSAIAKSKGVVILIFSRLPSTIVMACP